MPNDLFVNVSCRFIHIMNQYLGGIISFVLASNKELLIITKSINTTYIPIRLVFFLESMLFQYALIGVINVSLTLRRRFDFSKYKQKLILIDLLNLL